MKNLFIVFYTFLLLGASVNVTATQITFTDVSYEGTIYEKVGYDGSQITDSGNLTLLTDGVIPNENAFWMTNTVIFYGTKTAVHDQEYFTFDMGDMYDLADIILSVDNNDTYHIEYLVGSAWTNLFTISKNSGTAYTGMDTFSTDSSSIPSWYDSQIDFSTVTAQYLRISADHASGLSDQNFSIGEFQAFGEVYDDGNGGSIPEPATLALMGLGLAGIGYRHKAK